MDLRNDHVISYKALGQIIMVDQEALFIIKLCSDDKIHDYLAATIKRAVELPIGIICLLYLRCYFLETFAYAIVFLFCRFVIRPRNNNKGEWER